MFRIEVRKGDHQGWGPALMPSIGTNLTPERASTFETPEVAFETADKLARLQPDAAYRVVDATSGVAIWQPDIQRSFPGPTGAVYLNGEPAGPSILGAQMSCRVLRPDATSTDDNLSPPRQELARDLLSQIVASQEEFVGGLVQASDTANTLAVRGRGGLREGLDLRALANSLAEGAAAAQEILTNLRGLAHLLKV